jgi:hypothetical protein
VELIVVVSADLTIQPIAKIRHPQYSSISNDWTEWRLTFDGGKTFIDRYLEKYSAREDRNDFNRRKKYTYNPAFAEGAITDVKNSIYSRMTEITRTGGADSYRLAIQGKDGGVDLAGSSMNTFIGQQVLPELLTMARVGVFIDKGQLLGETIADNRDNRPYLYYYKVEDIRSWAFGRQNQLSGMDRFRWKSSCSLL